MRRGRALAAALAVVAGSLTAVATTTVQASAAPPARAAATIAWGSCTSPVLQLFSAQCGTVTVPLDYANPSGRKVHLAVSRITHTTAQYQGVMLVNPGGPGGSGLDLAYLGQFVPQDAGKSYDWIGFDPRGVGSSTPRLSCDPTYLDGPRPDYRPEVPGAEAAWLQRAKGYAADCAAADLELLRHMRTTDVARDVDEIRKALGQDQINYYGFSYGTYLAQVYTTLFPTRVRRMVLDGVVDPTRVFHQSNLDQDVAFERNINIWFGWVAKYDSAYHLGTTAAQVSQRWYAERDALRAHPAGGTIGSSEWSDVFLYAGYAEFLWPDLAQVFADWVAHRDPATLVDAYDAYGAPGDDNLFAVYNAVQCTDAPWPGSYAKYRKDIVKVDRQAPFFTWGNAWFNASCIFWPVAADKPVHVTGKGVGAFLLVNQTLDAATPYSGALEVRKLYKDAVLVAEPGGTTHAGSLNGNPCTDTIIARYLASGTLPARRPGNNRADVECAPLPQPVPTTPSAAAAPAGATSSRGTLALQRARLLATAPQG